LADGGILLAGRFSSYNGVPCGNVVKVDPNGVADPVFLVGAGADMEVFALATTADGQAVIGGLFDHVHEQPRPRIARLMLTDMSTGLAMNAHSSLVAWPNPTDGRVDLRWDGAPPAWAELLAPDGRTVARIAPGMGAGQLELGAYPAGTYLLRWPQGEQWRTLRLQRL
jgi:hypothetical protein